MTDQDMTTEERISRLEGALSDALGLLDTVIGGDQLYDPGTEDEQEGRDFILATYDEVQTKSRDLLPELAASEDQEEAGTPESTDPNWNDSLLADAYNLLGLIMDNDRLKYPEDDNDPAVEVHDDITSRWEDLEYEIPKALGLNTEEQEAGRAE